MKLTTGQTIRIIRMQQGIKQGALETICKELKTSPEEFFKIKRGLL